MTYLSIGDNYFTGPFATPTNWPPAMAFLDFGWNGITGNIPSTWPAALDINQNPMICGSPVWPSTPELHMNGLSCSGLNPKFPSSLQVLFLGWSGDWARYNKFSGTLLLKKPTLLIINRNFITNLVINDTSSLVICDLSNNPLLGSSSIAKLTMCTQDGLYSPISLLVKSKTTIPTKLEIAEPTIDNPYTTTKQSIFATATSSSTNSLLPYIISEDCEAVISMAYDMRMQDYQPDLLRSLEIECCTSFGITCDANLNVIRINWSGLGLSGHINSSLIPKALNAIDISRNAITGQLPDVVPDTLTDLRCGFNLLNGTIPTSWPVEMTFLMFEYNQITGPIPSLPDSLC